LEKHHLTIVPYYITHDEVKHKPGIYWNTKNKIYVGCCGLINEENCIHKCDLYMIYTPQTVEEFLDTIEKFKFAT